METVVCIKQVPDPNHIKIDQASGTVVREGVPSIINPLDKNALEAALVLRSQYGGRVTAVSMGPPAAREALQEALSLGADRAVLASDRAFAGADTLATARTLAALIKKLVSFDLVICGYHSIDGGTTQVGPQLARLLDIPHFTAVQKLSISGDKLLVETALEDGELLSETSLPALATVAGHINKPRGIRLSEAKKAKTRELLTWNMADLELTPELTGNPGSALVLAEKLPLPAGREAEMLTGEPSEVAHLLYEKIAKLGLGG